MSVSLVYISGQDLCCLEWYGGSLVQYASARQQMLYVALAIYGNPHQSNKRCWCFNSVLNYFAVQIKCKFCLNKMHSVCACIQAACSYRELSCLTHQKSYANIILHVDLRLLLVDQSQVSQKRRCFANDIWRLCRWNPPIRKQRHMKETSNMKETVCLQNLWVLLKGTYRDAISQPQKNPFLQDLVV